MTTVLNRCRIAKLPKREKEKHKTKRKHLDAYCTNLTAKAKNGEIDNIIGREKEIARVVQILSRRTKTILA